MFLKDLKIKTALDPVARKRDGVPRMLWCSWFISASNDIN